jgi:hypothetical protein
MHRQFNKNPLHFVEYYLYCPFSSYYKQIDALSNEMHWVFCGVNWMCKYKLDNTSNVCTLNRKIELVKTFWPWSATTIQHSGIIFVQLVIQDAVRMRHTDSSLLSNVWTEWADIT